MRFSYDVISSVPVFTQGAVTAAIVHLYNAESGSQKEPLINKDALKKALGPANWPTLSEDFVDTAAGFGDSISFNLTKHFREWIDVGSVDTKSVSYGYGNTSGTVFGLANAGRTGFQVYKGISKAKKWRTNSRTARKTRARKIAAAGSYRPSAGDAVLTLIGGSGVDSYVSLMFDED